MARLDAQIIRDGLSTGKCDVCRGFASGFWWAGETSIQVCEECALRKLPLLIADSLGQLTRESAERGLREMNEAYWRGIALRRLRERQEVAQ